MIHSFISVYSELPGVIKDEEQKQKFALIDYDVLLEFIVYFKQFVDVTEALSSDTYPTIHLMLPLKQRLVNLSKPNASDAPAIAALKRYMCRQITSYWKFEDVHLIAAILHPNLKHLDICPNDQDKCYRLLNDEIERRHLGKDVEIYHIFILLPLISFS